MKLIQGKAVFFAILAAALYALNSPISKLLLEAVPPTLMAALLYLGAGIGLIIIGFVQKKTGRQAKETPLAESDLSYIISMVVLDIAAPILLMIGLMLTTAANVSLLNSFEIVTTSIIALCVFKEIISKRLWLGIILVTVASVILSIEDITCFLFSTGSIFVLLACVCWGFENNCTRKLSVKNPLQIVIIKGLCSGTGSLIIGFFKGERFCRLTYALFALLLGFVAYGLSIFFYIYAQRELGAAKTSTYYAVAPFIGTALSLVIFRETPSLSFILALLIMIIGTYFASTEGRKRNDNGKQKKGYKV